MDPIEEAQELLAEIRQPRPLSERGAWAIDNARRIADGLEHLIVYAEKYRDTSTTEYQRLATMLSQLLIAIAPLLDAPQQTPFGRPSEHAAWLAGTAPRLRRAFTDAKQLLEGNAT